MHVSEPGIQESPDLRGGWSGLGPGNSAPVTEFCIFPPSPTLCSVMRGHPESTGVAPAPPHPRNDVAGTTNHGCTTPSLVLLPGCPSCLSQRDRLLLSHQNPASVIPGAFLALPPPSWGGAEGLITPSFRGSVGWAHVCLPYGALDSPTRSLAPSANRD